MTTPSPSVRRVLAGEVMGLPEGHVVRPTTPDDVPALTALMRAVDISGCGHSSSNIEEVTDVIADPDCGWEYGSATVWRGTELVGALFVFDGLASGRGWMIDVYARPGDARVHAIQGSLIDASLREGRYRWDALYMDPEVPLPTAKVGCYANDGAMIADLEQRGFTEVRRFWRMKVDHWSVDGPSSATSSDTPQDISGEGASPAGFVIRHFRGDESDWRGMHAASSLAFLDHFDFTPLDFDEWREHHRGETEDTTQWLVADHDGEIVGHVMGSNRYASDDCGYVASLGVVPEHRGQGVARALLRARLSDDIQRGFISTILLVDATSPTGATRLYESVGMSVTSEIIGLHRPLFR